MATTSDNVMQTWLLANMAP